MSGFFLYWEKSVLTPMHQPIFVGAETDLQNLSARSREGQKLLGAARSLRDSQFAPSKK